jgi:hypothetical protein
LYNADDNLGVVENWSDGKYSILQFSNFLRQVVCIEHGDMV